jgi:methylated-DNA-[protein]-cysteine S-methyltransferase
VTIVATGERITGLYFSHHWYRPAAETLGDPVDLSADPLIADAAQQLDAYLDGAELAHVVAASERRVQRVLEGCPDRRSHR